MKNLFSLLVAGFLVVGSFGCQEAPSSTNGSTLAPTKQASEGRTTVKETTTPLLGTKAKHKTDGDLKTTVSKRLQVGIPGNKFVVENEQGEITLKGVAKSQQEIKKAEQLVKDVKGVKSVKVEAKVEPTNRS